MPVAAGTAPVLLATFFHGLADPSRLSCLLALRERPCTVSEVVAATGLSQSNVSKHLACLRDCGLVQAERQGRFMLYCLCGTGVEEVLRAAETVLSQAGEGIAICSDYQLPGTGAPVPRD
jgi:DNA-binding transcriptional ArsR family regulator